MKRGLSALLALILLVGVTSCGIAFSSPGSTTPPESNPAHFWKNWQTPQSADITYTVHYDPDAIARRGALPYTLRVIYMGPNLCRVERSGFNPFIAVANRDGVKVYYPNEHIAFWLPRDSKFRLDILDLNITASDPWADQKDMKYQLYDDTNEGEGEQPMPPDEKVQGRICTLMSYNYAGNNKLKDPSKGYSNQYIDRQYGIVLGETYADPKDDKYNKNYIASKVGFNKAIDSKLFSLQIPEGTPVFRGDFSEFDVKQISRLSKANWSFRGVNIAAPEQWTEPINIIVPGYLPTGFAEISTQTSWSYSNWQHTWEIWATWVNRSGSSLRFHQAMRKIDSDIAERAAFISDIKLHGISAKLYKSSQPFPQLSITWQQNGKYLELIGVGVDKKTLLQIAASCRGAVLEPDSTIDLKTPAEAQPLVGYQLYEPSYLPAGFTVAGTYLAYDCAVFVDYKDSRGTTINLSQFARKDAADFFDRTSRANATATVVNGNRAWYSRQAVGLILEWRAGVKLFSVSGDVSKNELMRIAESLRPVSQARK